jgi:hypothetical protein
MMPLAPNHSGVIIRNGDDAGLGIATMTKFSRASSDWRTWYQLEKWRKRRRHQLRKAPLCEMCLKIGKLERASIADHVVSHKGDWNWFWLGELQSLCKPCHDSRKKFVDFRGYDPTIGEDGWPIDPRHPVYR